MTSKHSGAGGAIKAAKQQMQCRSPVSAGGLGHLRQNCCCCAHMDGVKWAVLLQCPAQRIARQDLDSPSLLQAATPSARRRTSCSRQLAAGYKARLPRPRRLANSRRCHTKPCQAPTLPLQPPAMQPWAADMAAKPDMPQTRSSEVADLHQVGNCPLQARPGAICQLLVLLHPQHPPQVTHQQAKGSRQVARACTGMVLPHCAAAWQRRQA